MTTVSVILPTYNRAHLVGRAIQSVLNQTYRDFELIVVDDGSADETEEVVKGFNDPRIRYIRHEINKGSAAARNTGIRAARGEYLAFQDSDDEWLPKKLDLQMNIFSKTPKDVGIVYTDMWRIQDGIRTYWHSPSNMPVDGLIYKKALNNVFGIGVGTALIKRVCINETGVFDESLPRLIDFEFFIRLSKYYHFLHIKKPLVKYYHTKKSICANNEALLQAYELIFKKYHKDMSRESMAGFQFIVGNKLCQEGKMDIGKYYLFSAVRSYPLNLKYLVAAFVSLFGENSYKNICILKQRINLHG